VSAVTAVLWIGRKRALCSNSGRMCSTSPTAALLSNTSLERARGPRLKL
jgi:hypothetical protein